MKRKGAARRDDVYYISRAANEQFTGMVNGLDSLARHQSGWDPYEVWRTRVKGSFSVMQEPPFDRRAMTVEFAGPAPLSSA